MNFSSQYKWLQIRFKRIDPREVRQNISCRWVRCQRELKLQLVECNNLLKKDVRTRLFEIGVGHHEGEHERIFQSERIKLGRRALDKTLGADF